MLKPSGYTPQARAGMTLSIIRDCLYLFGGSGHTTRCFNDVHVYDPKEQAWFLCAQADLGDGRGVGPARRAGHVAVAVDRRLFVSGGACGTQYYGKGKWYILDTDAPPPIEVSAAPACGGTEEQFSDVCFVVEGKRLYGHRVLLTLFSDYFRKAFACGMRESFEPDIIIEEMGAIHWGLMGRGSSCRRDNRAERFQALQLVQYCEWRNQSAATAACKADQLRKELASESKGPSDLFTSSRLDLTLRAGQADDATRLFRCALHGRSGRLMWEPKTKLARKRRQEQCRKSCACVVISSLVATIVIQCLAKPVEVTVPNTPEVPAAQPYLAACSAHAKCAQQGQDDCCPSSDGVLMGCCSPIPSSVKVDPFRGMCYAPTPAKNVAPWAEALWGKSGRDDLSAIRQMGFKVLRVYGNDPRLSHEAFLSRCTALGLKVIVAISDFPYTQERHRPARAPNRSPATTAVAGDRGGRRPGSRLQFTTMLKNGFTVRDGEGQMRYHPAIEAIILINEPELKITYQGAIAKDAWSKGSLGF
eukprot:g12400.t1